MTIERKINYADRAESLIPEQLKKIYDGPSRSANPPGPVERIAAWYKGDNNTIDSAGSNDAFWIGTPEYGSGVDGNCFNVGVRDAAGHLDIPYSSQIDIGGDNKIGIDFNYNTNAPTLWMGNLQICKANNYLFDGWLWMVQLIESTDLFGSIDLSILTPASGVQFYRGINSVGNWQNIKVLIDNGMWDCYADGDLLVPETRIAERVAIGTLPLIITSTSYQYKAAINNIKISVFE